MQLSRQRVQVRQVKDSQLLRDKSEVFQSRADGRQVWVNFAVPDYDRVQVIDTPSQRVVDTLRPGKAVLHMEFTPRGDAVWISCRDDHLVRVIDTATRQTLATLAVDAPSGIFFTSRAQRMGF